MQEPIPVQVDSKIDEPEPRTGVTPGDILSTNF